MAKVKNIKAKIRRRVLERDGFQCINCGYRFDLTVHHIIPRNLAPERKNDMGNMFTLCKECHFQIHRWTGFCRNPEKPPEYIAARYSAMIQAEKYVIRSRDGLNPQWGPIPTMSTHRHRLGKDFQREPLALLIACSRCSKIFAETDLDLHKITCGI